MTPRDRAKALDFVKHDLVDCLGLSKSQMVDEIERAIAEAVAEAVAEERKACTAVADDHEDDRWIPPPGQSDDYKRGYFDGTNDTSRMIAEAIRARTG